MNKHLNRSASTTYLRGNGHNNTKLELRRVKYKTTEFPQDAKIHPYILRFRACGLRRASV